VFGSYVSDTLAPNDVDVVLVMRDDFRPELCPPEALPLFDHNQAARELGASIFWVRPGMLWGSHSITLSCTGRSSGTAADEESWR
jgi:hypothetical protein